MSRFDELQKLQTLKEQGVLSESEFETQKERLLSQPDVPPPPPSAGGFGATTTDKPWGMDLRLYCMLLHFSQFAGYVFVGLGFALPIVMWYVNKDQFPEVDAHGRVVLNWMISSLIYAAVCFLLFFILIGIPMMFALGLASIVFTIIGALKANDGIVWKYPGSIRFL